MLDLYEPEEEEMLDLLTPLLLDEDVAPSDQGLHALRVALDAKFGAEHRPEADAEAAVVPLRRRLTRIVTGVAAAVVVLALVLAWYGWHQAPGPSAGRTKLEDATAALRTALRDGSPQTRLERDITSLAGAMSSLPTSERTDMTTAPKQLIASACQWLVGSSAASQTPSTSLPQVCDVDGQTQVPAPSTSPAGGVSRAGPTAESNSAPDQQPASARTGTKAQDLPESRSPAGLSVDTTTGSWDTTPHQTTPHQYDTSAPSTATTVQTSPAPDQQPANAWSGTQGQDPPESPWQAGQPSDTTTPQWDSPVRPSPHQRDTPAPSTVTPTQTGWPTRTDASDAPTAPAQSPATQGEGVTSSQSAASTDPDSPHALSTSSPGSPGSPGTGSGFSAVPSGASASGFPRGSQPSRP